MDVMSLTNAERETPLRAISEWCPLESSSDERFERL